MCNYCKAKGANSGCCYDVGSDTVLRFCSKKYHIDCGLKAGVLFSISNNRGAVSLCYDHRDKIERSGKKLNQSNSDWILILFISFRVNELTEDGEESQNDSLSVEEFDEYDVGQREANNVVESIVLERTTESHNAESDSISHDPLGEEDVDHSASEMKDGDNWLDDETNASSAQAVAKVELIGDEQEPFNVASMQHSLGSISNASDCEITCEYQIDIE